MRKHAHDELHIAKEAAEWLSRLQESGARENPAFSAWLVSSPSHVEAFLNMTAVDRLLDRVDPQHRIDVEKLLADASNVQPLPPRIDTSVEAHALLSVLRRRRWAAAGAAVVAIVAVAAWFWPFAGQTFATDIGEQRTVELSDGSVINLNTRSRATVRFSARGREIRLEGEAMFKVAADPARPFRVHSGNAVVRAIGTQFNVHRRPSGTVVSVIEGAVQILNDRAIREASRTAEPPHSQPTDIFKAGEEARVSQDGQVERRAGVRSVDASTWRQQRLIFSDDRLDDIVAEFNRWNREQIRVEDAAVAARLYSGAFDADDPESLGAFLSRERDLAVERQGDEIVIRPR